MKGSDITREAFKKFNPYIFVRDGYEEQNLDIALSMFTDKLMELVNEHAPLRKRSVRGK